MNKNPVAVVLGGTVPHKFLIQNLKGRGYHTVLVDYYDNPPAAEMADRHIKESTLDLQAVLDIANEEKASLVISGCVDQANVTACYVAEKIGLPAPYSYETALRVTDKELMKEGMVRAGVPTAKYRVVDGSEAPEFNNTEFPKVVKPCDCNGSKGVRKVKNQSELTQALGEACELSRTSRAIFEDYNAGTELNGYFFVGNGNAVELYMKGKELPGGDGHESLQSYVSIGPAEISDKARSKLAAAAVDISREFGVHNTPLLVQANIDGDDVKVIEFAPRVGGGLAFREILMGTGFDVIDAVVASYLGEEVGLPNLRKINDSFSIVHLYGESGLLDRVEGNEKLVADRVVEEFHMHKSKGMRMSSEDLASRNRVAGVIIRFSSIPEYTRKINDIVSEFKIYSDGGSDVFERSLLSELLESMPCV
ncbi:acetyl-CoA carboxylase biotin carboxylase subunit family protein [Thioalkalivibrio sp. ALM2T]|uniref:ATP-grasp domain-containing protein n=1 Tax=Thioalkalivibrio sp. ALM2T TaxID=1158184 RepID=UPI0012DE6287|nr:ATP-grasp domain-containing protein [Thioalkalivibrio sp. ALM2T]